jgi:hypothetical protein
MAHTLEPPTKPEPKAPTEPPFTRRRTQEYLNEHHPQTPRQLREHVEKTLHFYKTGGCSGQITPTDDELWKWFQINFALWSTHDFKNLDTNSQKELRRYLRCGGVFIRPNDKTIAQALYKAANEAKQHIWTNEDIAKCKEDLKKGPITSIWITATRDRRLPLPFASFDQEAIPLRLQYKELPEERQKRLYQERLRQQKKAQERQEQEQ